MTALFCVSVHNAATLGKQNHGKTVNTFMETVLKDKLTITSSVKPNRTEL